MFGANSEQTGGHKMSALLEHGCEFDGKLNFDGTVRINGKFTGEIFSDGTLVVGEEAIIEAKIEVGSIIINGKVRGEIVAQDRIEMNSPAEVRGDIQARTLVIEEGVVFEGSCKMGDRGRASLDFDRPALGQTGRPRAIDEVSDEDSDLQVV